MLNTKNVDLYAGLDQVRSVLYQLIDELNTRDPFALQKDTELSAQIEALKSTLSGVAADTVTLKDAVPKGGNTSDILAKRSDEDMETEWMPRISTAEIDSIIEDLEAAVGNRYMGTDGIKYFVGKIQEWLKDMVKREELSAVAFSGDYNDLINKPDDPSLPGKRMRLAGNSSCRLTLPADNYTGVMLSICGATNTNGKGFYLVFSCGTANAVITPVKAAGSSFTVASAGNIVTITSTSTASVEVSAMPMSNNQTNFELG